jgi:hypothetical protein
MIPCMSKNILLSKKKGGLSWQTALLTLTRVIINWELVVLLPPIHLVNVVFLPLADGT